MKSIILASSSPRRRELLSQIGLKYVVMTSDTDETTSKEIPYEVVMELSLKKAKAVYDKLDDYAKDNSIVIGADTIVSFNDRILLKPKSGQEAFETLKSLSGQTHQVYTGVSIVSSGGIHSFYEKTDVEFYKLSDSEIKEYIDTKDPMDKAGSYGIQGMFARYVKGIDGDYNNVVGLPVGRLYQEIKEFL